MSFKAPKSAVPPSSPPKNGAKIYTHLFYHKPQEKKSPKILPVNSAFKRSFGYQSNINKKAAFFQKFQLLFNIDSLSYYVVYST